MPTDQFAEIDGLHLTLQTGHLDGVLHVDQAEGAGGDDDVGPIRVPNGLCRSFDALWLFIHMDGCRDNHLERPKGGSRTAAIKPIIR